LNQSPRDGPIKARVTHIGQGHDGPYAKCRATSGKRLQISVSLKKPIWEDEKMPAPGDHVLLDDVRERPKGWRSYTGRIFRLSDAEALKKQQREKRVKRKEDQERSDN